MKQYKVKHGQNIYDVSLQLYGSIEGVFDLLVNNSHININDFIDPGTIVNYDEGFQINADMIKWLEDNKVTVANGDHIYDVSIADISTLRIQVHQIGPTSVLGIRLNSGNMVIDWGDGTGLDVVNDTAEHELDHPYKDDGGHIIRIYGGFSIRDIDLREIGGLYYALSNCHVSGTFQEATNREDLQTLFR